MIPKSPEAYEAIFYIKTHFIMRVLSFNPDAQTVDLIQDVYEYVNIPMGNMSIVNEFGNEVTVGLKEPTILKDIPVKQLRWGQFEIQCCPKEGDTGYIEIMTNDIRDWIQHGSRSIPWTDNHFMKESSVFVPFVPNYENRSTTYPEDNSTLVIRSENANITITDKAEEGQEPVVDIATTSNTVHISAKDGVSVVGNLDVDGDITATGTITATGDIKSTDGDIIAGEISLKNHTHNFTYVGAGQGSSLQNGTTKGAN